MEVRRLANGDVTIAIKPAVAGAPAKTDPARRWPRRYRKGRSHDLAGTAANVVGTSPVILGTAAGITAAGAVAATVAESPSKAPSRSPATLPILPGPPLSGWPTGSSSLP